MNLEESCGERNISRRSRSGQLKPWLCSTRSCDEKVWLVAQLLGASFRVSGVGLVLLRLDYCGGPLCKGTFSTGFSGLVNEPAKPSKTVGHSIETISELHFAPTVIADHVGTLNGAISSILGAGHGMAEHDAAGCPSKKSVACPRA